MSFKDFASVTRPLTYKPDAPKRPLLLSVPPPEPYPPGSLLRVIAVPEGEENEFELYETFVVHLWEASFDPDEHGPYYYEPEDRFGSWSNYVEFVS